MRCFTEQAPHMHPGTLLNLIQRSMEELKL